MNKKNLKSEKKTIKPKITHVMSDGTVRDSIEGVMIPKYHPVYNVICKAYRNGILTKQEQAGKLLMNLLRGFPKVRTRIGGIT